MKKIIYYTLILLAGLPFCSNAQNCISNFSLETQCIDAFNFTASITFTHTLEDGDMLAIIDKNGVDYGYYNPNEQPIILDILLPNSLMNEVGFTLVSMNDPNCVVQSPGSFVLCNECDLSASVLALECIENTDNYMLNLELINEGSMSVSNYYVKHTDSGSEYGPFTSAAAGDLQTIEIELPNSQQGEFSIYDPNRLCLAFVDAINECNPSPPCMISNVSLRTECLQASTISATIEFDYEGVPNDMVTITDTYGQNYGPFLASNQPILIETELPELYENDVQYTVRSTQDTSCHATSTMNTISCYSCDIEVTNVSAECIPGSDNYRLALNVRSIGDSPLENFKLTHAETGQFIGSFNNYSPTQSRIIQVHLSTELQGNFIVSDDKDKCMKTVEAEIDCSAPQCYISNVDFEIECINKNNFTADVAFDFEEMESEMVNIKDVLGNDYGEFNSNEQPIIIDVSLQESDSRDFGFIVTSLMDEKCIAESDLQTIECFDCDMQVGEPSLVCTPGSDLYRLSIEVQSFGSFIPESFSLRHTSTGQFIGMFTNYAPDRPRLISTFLATSMFGEFTISDSDDMCQVTFFVQDECSGPMCYISDVSFDTDCIDRNNFVANLTFEHQDMENNNVTVTDVHGNEYGVFDANQQPISLDVVLKETDSREFGFIVQSEVNVECLSESPIQTVQCIDCKLDAKILHYECDEAEENYHLALEIINNGDTDGVKYVVTHAASGNFVGTYSHFGATPSRMIDFYKPIDMQGEFLISIEGTNCATGVNVQVDCEAKHECHMEGLKVTSTDCNEDGTYNLIVNYTLDNPDDELVEVSLNGGEVQLYNNTGIIQLNNLSGEDEAEYDTIEVCSNHDSECCQTIQNQRPNCTSNEPECELSITQVDFECHEEMPNHLTLLLSVEGNSTNNYHVNVNGVATSIGNLTEANIELGPILSNDDGYYFIEIIDAVNSDCKASTELNQAFCDANCKIGEVDVNTTCSENGLFNASITFAYENPTAESTIDIEGNGIFYGSFKVSEQPIVLDQLRANDFEEWEFIVIDKTTDDCQSRKVLGSIDCEDDLLECTLKNIAVYDLACTSNNEYEMFLSFEFDSALDMEFSCYINGEMQVNANTSLLPMKMSGVTTESNNGQDVITICIDNMNEECCLDYTYEKPNCLSNSTVNNSIIESINISPNPATNIITISDLPQNVFDLTIVDNMGRPIKKMEAIENLVLDISKFSSGLYTIYFSTRDNRVISRRFVKL